MFTRIIVRERYLYVIITGRFDLGEAKRSFLQIMEAVNRNAAIKVLIDGRELSGEPTVIERYLYGEFAAHIATWAEDKVRPERRPQFSYALVHPTLDPKRLGETVAANRGMKVGAFDNLPEAATWLGLHPTEIGLGPTL